MTSEEKIKYVRDRINELAEISPRGPLHLFLYAVSHPDNEEWTILTRGEQWLIIRKLEEENFIKNVQFDEDKHGVWFEEVTRNENRREKPLIREQTLEHIARHLGGHGSGTQIVGWLKSWDVPETIINSSGSKWWMVNEVLKHYAYSTEKKDHGMLFKIVGEMLHPVMYNGDKKAAETAAEDFNKYLEYDNLATLSDGKNEYSVCETKNLIEVDENDILSEENEELFQREYDELGFLRHPENKEKISTLRKAYQVFMNIAEVFCDNPSKPSHQLNDAYVKTKKLITDAVRDLRLYVNSVSGRQRIHTLTHYFIPFNNLFTAEKEYTPDNLEIDLSGKKLSWDYIRPQMNATYGDIDELYRKVEGSEVLSKPDVQQTLNEISLLLSKTKEENKKLTKTRQKTPVPQTPVQKIEITAIPELVIRNVEDNTLTKGKKRVRLPMFPHIPWDKASIRFLDERNVIITGDKKTVTTDYEGLGFSNDKSNKPNLAWGFLFGIAKNNGETPRITSPIPDNVKQLKLQISDFLKNLYHNTTEPFEDFSDANTYKLRIKLIPPELDAKNSKSDDPLGIKEYLNETMITKHEDSKDKEW